MGVKLHTAFGKTYKSRDGARLQENFGHLNHALVNFNFDKDISWVFREIM